MEYLAAHAGYTRVHNPHTGEKDLVQLPGLAAVAYQHETSRCGDPHLHTHVIVPNRQARADGQMVSIDGTSLYHEARAAGVIYQATLRRELHQSMGFEWAPVDPSTGMAELAGVDRDTITAWSRRSIAAARVGGPQPRRRRRSACRRRSWRPRRKQPDQPNPKNSPGHSSWSSGAPTRAACTSTARHSTKPARRDAQPQARRWTGRAWPRRPRRLRRRRSPGPTSSRSSAPNLPVDTDRSPRRDPRGRRR